METQAPGLRWAWTGLQAPEALDKRRPVVSVLPSCLCVPLSVPSVRPARTSGCLYLSVSVRVVSRCLSVSSFTRAHTSASTAAVCEHRGVRAGDISPTRWLPNPLKMACTARTVPACVPWEQPRSIWQDAGFPERQHANHVPVLPSSPPTYGTAGFPPQKGSRGRGVNGVTFPHQRRGRGRQPEGARCPCGHTMAV